MRTTIFIAAILAVSTLSAGEIHQGHYGYGGGGSAPSPGAARQYLHDSHTADVMVQESCNYAYGSASSRRYLGHITRDVLQAYGYTRTECEIARLVLWAEYKYVGEDMTQTWWDREYPWFTADVRAFGRHFEKVLRCHVEMDADELPTPGFAATYALALEEFESGTTREGNCPDVVVPAPSTPVGLPEATTATQS